MAEGTSIYQFKTTAPFNSAVATLELENETHKKIIVASSSRSLSGDETVLTRGKAQHIKADLLRQYYIVIAPLIEDKDFRKMAQAKIFSFEKRLQYFKKVDTVQNKQTGIGEAYDAELEIDLDECLLELREKLQEENNFYMPSKTDPRHAFKQHR